MACTELVPDLDHLADLCIDELRRLLADAREVAGSAAADDAPGGAAAS